ncbi:centromere protein T [Crotalus adamanteus]|uniref:Centromere protein T n=1 Tax=Crotalus adamanteus TaxID=8729 RepID=A0AAW1ASR7_CROAD
MPPPPPLPPPPPPPPSPGGPEAAGLQIPQGLPIASPRRRRLQLLLRRRRHSGSLPSLRAPQETELPAPQSTAARPELSFPPGTASPGLEKRGFPPGGGGAGGSLELRVPGAIARGRLPTILWLYYAFLLKLDVPKSVQPIVSPFVSEKPDSPKPIDTFFHFPEKTDSSMSLQISFTTPAPLNSAGKKGLMRRPKHYRGVNVKDFEGGLEQGLLQIKDSIEISQSPRVVTSNRRASGKTPKSLERTPFKEMRDRTNPQTGGRNKTKEKRNVETEQILEFEDEDNPEVEMSESEDIEPTGKTPAFVRAKAFHCTPLLSSPRVLREAASGQGLITDKMPLHVLVERHLPFEYRKLLIPIATSGNKVIPQKLK